MMIYPKEIPNRRGKLAYLYETFQYQSDLGRGKVMGKITQPMTEAGMLLLLIDKLGYANIPLWVMGCGVFGGIVLVWFCGWCYQWLGMDRISNLVHRKRDPMFVEIYENAKKDR